GSGASQVGARVGAQVAPGGPRVSVIVEPGASVPMSEAQTAPATVDPAHRLRRMRRTPPPRSLVRETRIHPRQLVAPIFVQPGRGLRDPISSLPGVARLSPDEAVAASRRYAELGSRGCGLLFLPGCL